MSGDFLKRMAESSRQRTAAAMRLNPAARMRAQALASAAPQPLVLNAAGFDIIAELKLRSPAAGAVGTPEEDIGRRVGRYASGGAAAVSVLTEPSEFAGELAHLELAARALQPAGIPALRKDFLVDPYQVAEARVAGAGGVLIILRMLARDELQALMAEAERLGLFVLLEAFDEVDLELAHELVAGYRDSPNPTLLVGVNCRDLVTLQVVPARLERLGPLLPGGVPHVAESGIACAADARRVRAAGYDLALVGSALMRASDPEELLRQMLSAGRV
ncbi:MAG TPA: indole-3-glycerol-phosphate synthase [Steroidobacteraceae bacterium]|jgi:indole-3-glycerol phosphate synthase|nr:indole-3-glycerol-phosphate synthase [Steroidobacteraceae bacterium]